MTDLQTRTERMAEACLEVLNTDPIKTIVDADNIWKGRRTKLGDKLDDIDEIEIAQEINNTGIELDKQQLKITMTQLGFTMGKRIQSLAVDMNDETLSREINFRYTALASVKDSTAINRCQAIKNHASTLIATPPGAPIVFADYNITLAGAAALQNAIDAFKNYQGKPKAAIATVKAATLDLDHAFDDLDKILQDLDSNADQVRFTNANLWEQWQAARKRDDTGIRHLSARIIIIDEVTSVRIGAGFVKVDPINFIKQATRRSIVSLKDSETGTGTFDLEVGAPTYETNILRNVVFEPNKLTKLIVKLKQIRDAEGNRAIAN